MNENHIHYIDDDDYREMLIMIMIGNSNDNNRK